jgi:hypothetical protein
MRGGAVVRIRHGGETEDLGDTHAFVTWLQGCRGGNL